MIRAAALALALASAAGAARAAEPPFALEPVMDCRARAIAQLELADWRFVAFKEDATRAIRDQADFAIVLGLWGAAATSVDQLVGDMALGERVLIDNAQRALGYQRDWAANGPYDVALAACVPVVWGAAKAVMDRVLSAVANRGR